MKELYANTIKEGTWRYLDLFSRYEFLKKISPDAEKARHISFCLKQAKEYYQSAKLCSILTKPVILYYGMLNLAKSLIFLKDPTIVIETHLKKHGLGREKKKSKSLFSLSCKIGKKQCSVFTKLLKVAKSDGVNIPIVIDGNPARRDIKIDYSNQTNNVGKSYQVSELLILLPELFDLIFEATKLLPRTVPLLEFGFNQQIDKQNNKTLISNGSLIFKHNRYPKIKTLVKSFEKKSALKDWSFIEDKWDIMSYRLPQKVKSITFPNMRETIFRENYALLLPSKKSELSEIVVHFMLIFIFGDVARYNPYIWSRLMESKIQESRVIEAFLDLTAIKFPLLILRELKNELIYFKQI